MVEASRFAKLWQRWLREGGRVAAKQWRCYSRSAQDVRLEQKCMMQCTGYAARLDEVICVVDLL